MVKHISHLLPRLTGNSKTPAANASDITSLRFNPGDKVLVRPKDQIQATLDGRNELKGCSFLAEMGQYCGTIQTVFKPVRRFVDERESRVKSMNGVYLLEGVICKGLDLTGGCDRSCFYYWREEWLEKIDLQGES